MKVQRTRNTARWSLVHSSDRAINAFWLITACFTSMVLAVLLVWMNGDVVLGIAFLALTAVVGLSIYRLEWGFYIIVLCALAFDQHPIPQVQSITVDVRYFLNLNIWPGAPRGLFLSAFEVHSLVILLIWIVAMATRKDLKIIGPAHGLAPSLFFMMMLFGWIHGMGTGGDLQISFWEMRAMLYLGVFTWWTPQIVRTPAQLKSLFWVIIAGISVKAMQGTYRFATNGFSFGRWPNILETYTSHEDPLFMILLIFFLGGLLIYKARVAQRYVLYAIMPFIFFGYIAAQRRATYASFMASGIVFFMLMPRRQKIALSKFLVVFGVLFGIYLGAYWNSYSRAGAIAQQFKATVTDEPGIRGSKDISSTLYRKSENFNLVTTIRHSPAIGVGYGKPFERPLLPWGSVFPLSDYIPHNQIFWIFAKLGIIGGFCFWFMFNSFALQGAIVFYRLADPYFKAICAVCVIAIANQLVVSYVDMQLTFYRNMIVLGVLMGTIQVLDRWTSGEFPEITIADK